MPLETNFCLDKFSDRYGCGKSLNDLLQMLFKFCQTRYVTACDCVSSTCLLPANGWIVDWEMLCQQTCYRIAPFVSVLCWKKYKLVNLNERIRIENSRISSNNRPYAAWFVVSCFKPSYKHLVLQIYGGMHGSYLIVAARWSNELGKISELPPGCGNT